MARIEDLKPRATRYAQGFGGGLQLVIHPSGRRTWVYRFAAGDGYTSRRIGEYPRCTVAAARSSVAKIKGMVTDAQDTRAVMDALRAKTRRHRATVSEFAKRWLAEIVAKTRKDPAPVARLIERDILPWIGRHRLATIQAADVMRIVFRKRDAGRPEAAAAIRHTLKRLFDYAVVCGEAQQNPAAAVPLKFVTQHRTRSRVLSHAELRLFYAKLKDPQLGLRNAIVLELLLLTLARKSELRMAKWEHVDLAARTWEVPAESSKTGRAHIVYLSERARELFALSQQWASMKPGALVFPSQGSESQPLSPSWLNKAIARVRWGMPHFTPHDLRRTGSTILHELGYNPDWIEKAMNHSVRGVRGVYNRAQYAEERKRMLQEWADWLEKMK